MKMNFSITIFSDFSLFLVLALFYKLSRTRLNLNTQTVMSSHKSHQDRVESFFTDPDPGSASSLLIAKQEVSKTARYGTGTGYLPLDRVVRIPVRMDYLLTCGSKFTRSVPDHSAGTLITCLFVFATDGKNYALYLFFY